jgi:cell division transport system permease protein
MAYALREAASAFRRAPLLTGLSAGMIALSLFLLGLFGIVAYNIREVLERVEARVEVVAYLKDDAVPEMVNAARAEIGKHPTVREVRYISREQALQKARAELPEFRAIFGAIDQNPLPASLEISLQPGQQGPEPVKAVADRVAAFPFVEDVRYGSEWLDKVYLLRRVAAAATLVLGTAFAIVAALIIGAAVRISIFARRDEIAIMRLVGATDGFVKRPFLIEGLTTGVIGGLLALAATWGAHNVVSRSLFALEWIPDLWIVCGLAGGAVLGAVASAIAVRRHLGETY